MMAARGGGGDWTRLLVSRWGAEIMASSLRFGGVLGLVRSLGQNPMVEQILKLDDSEVLICHHVLDEAEGPLHDALCVMSQTVKDSRVCITIEDEEDIAKVKDYTPSASGASAAAPKESSEPTPPKKEVVVEPVSSPEPKVSPSEDRIFASPLARHGKTEVKKLYKRHLLGLIAFLLLFSVGNAGQQPPPPPQCHFKKLLSCLHFADNNPRQSCCKAVSTVLPDGDLGCLCFMGFIKSPVDFNQTRVRGLLTTCHTNNKDSLQSLCLRIGYPGIPHVPASASLFTSSHKEKREKGAIETRR